MHEGSDMNLQAVTAKYQEKIRSFDSIIETNENLLRAARQEGDSEKEIILRLEDIKKFKELRRLCLDFLIDIGVTRDYVEKMIHKNGLDIA